MSGSVNLSPGQCEHLRIAAIYQSYVVEHHTAMMCIDVWMVKLALVLAAAGGVCATNVVVLLADGE